MSTNDEKARQEVSLVGRILSMEALLLLMGLVSLVYGIVNGEAMSAFFGIIIITGVFILAKIRKKDWKKHWEEMEAEQNACEAWKKRQSPPDEPKEG